ncbi:MAG TPA: hypothetical protein VII31_02245, partial [Caldimonas sp.]
DEAATVGAVVALARAAYGAGEWRAEAEASGPHEAGLLSLEIARARTALGVAPRWSLDEAVRRTMLWYRHLAGGGAARSLCEADIADYEASARPDVGADASAATASRAT